MSFFKNLLSRHLLGRKTPPSSLPPAARYHIAGEAAAATNTVAQRERMLPANHPLSIHVQRMAAGLIAAACDDANYGPRGLSPRIRRPFRGIDWSVGVAVDAEDANGSSTAGGRIWITTELLLEYRDPAVAAVLAHEIGHVIVRHTGKRNRNWVLAGFLTNFAGELLDARPGDEKETRSALWSLFMRPWYYRQEYEADRLGLLLLAAAGYDPHAVLPMCGWLWPGEMGDPALDNPHSRHPPSKERRERLLQAKVMDQALDLYRQAAARSARRGCQLR